MVSAGSYLLSVVLLTAVGLSVGFSAFRIRRHLLPAWEGAPARLVEAVLAVALLIWLSELLGLFGLLYASTLVIESLLLAGAIALWPIGAASEERGGEVEAAPPAPAVSRGMTFVAVAVVFVVFAHWGVYAKDALDRGISNYDSLWYQMPLAADIAQGHSVTALHYINTVYTSWLYPQNSELVHAAGILLTQRDTLSLFANFAWLGLALLAAWCIGRPYGRGPLCVVAAAIVLDSTTLLEREPGAAKDDVMAAALLLAAVAILVTAWTQRRSPTLDGEKGKRLPPPGPTLAAAGLALGIAAGAKVTVLAMGAGLSIAILALAPAGHRSAAAWRWFGAGLAGGGFWYARDLVAAGNPIPELTDLGPLSLPHPVQLQSGRPTFAIAHYLTDTAVWREYFGPGLAHGFGGLWPLVVGGAIVGGLLALRGNGERMLQWLGGVVLLGVVAYLFTPASAAGAEGAPLGFRFNLRFAVPALLVGLALLPLAPGLSDRRRQWALLGALVALLLITDGPGAELDNAGIGFGLLVGLVAAAVPAVALADRHRRVPRGEAVAGLALLGLLVATIGYPLQRHYLRGRFAAHSGIPGYGFGPMYQWARGTSGARIGLVGVRGGFVQYGLYGADLSNRVVYLGEKGARGAFNPIPDCAGFRAAVNDADLDYLVTSPFFDESIASPEANWLVGSAGVEPIERSRLVTLWRVRGALDPADCGRENMPLRFVPQQPTG